MENKTKKQIFVCASVADLKMLEEHFSKMAARGWLLTHIKPFFYEYRETEARELQFAVDILPQVSAFDYPENDNVKEYRRICEESGWMFAAASKQMQTFYSEKKNDMPIPIHTDPKIEAQIMLKSCRAELFGFLINLIFWGWLSFLTFKDGCRLFLSNGSLATALLIIFFLPALLWQLFFSLSWYMKTTRSLKKDLPLPKVNFRLSKVRNNFFIASAIVSVFVMLIGYILDMTVGRGQGAPAALSFIFLIFLGSAFGGLFIRKQIDTKERGKKTNIAIFVGGLTAITVLSVAAVSLIFMSSGPSAWKDLPLPPDRAALKLSDFGINETPEYANYRSGGSLVVPLDYSYDESDPAGGVRTKFTKTLSRALALQLFRMFYEEEEETHYRRQLGVFTTPNPGQRPPLTALTAAEAESFGAEEGYYLNPDNTEVLLLYENSILQVHFSGELPLPEVKQRIGQILRQ